jgi:hypothetical protein
MPTEKNAVFLPRQWGFKLERQRVKAGCLKNANHVYTRVSAVTETPGAAHMDIFSQVVCYNTVFPE